MLFGKTPLKAQITIFSKNFLGGMALLAPLATPMSSCTTISINALFNKSVNHYHI